LRRRVFRGMMCGIATVLAWEEEEEEEEIL